MNDSLLTTIAITGFGIAFFHAAIPTHWLPFVLTARLQHWNRAKTLAITAIAATGHATFTALLGLGIAWLGIALSARIGDWFPRIAGGILIAFGLFYIVRQLSGHPHTHLHFRQRHSHSHPHDHDHGDHDDHHSPRGGSGFTRSDLAAIGSLLALLTFSPCEAFVPVYVSGVRYGWHGFALLTIILTFATIAGMVAFTFLALIGIEQVKLRSLEKYEAVLMGALLCLVGVLIILLEKMTAKSSSLSVGDPAPDFNATVVGGKYGAGKVVRLRDLRGSPVVLYFYPKDDTPGCTAQACGLRDEWRDFKNLGEVFGVSIDSSAKHEKFIAKYSLPFPLLSDPDKKLVNDYGVWVQKTFLGKKYMGTERTTFVINKDGRIAAILRKVKPAEHAGDLRAALAAAAK